jgi:hypothetical protein
VYGLPVLLSRTFTTAVNADTLMEGSTALNAVTLQQQLLHFTPR